MPRAQSPNRRLAYQLWAESGGKRKLTDIAAQIGVTPELVRKWKSLDGWEKVTLPKKNGNVTDSVSKRKRGAPRGNRNGIGNSGGAPAGNANALIHGGYSPVYFDTLTDEEKAFVTGDRLDPETLLNEEILLLSIRERRIMGRIRTFAKIAESEDNQVMASRMRTEELREFSGESAESEREDYERIRAEKIEDGDALPGHAYSLTTRTESAYDIVQRLEEALTRCQSQKRQCIQQLAELRRASEESLEIEDMDSVEANIYGGQHQEPPDNSV